MGKDEFSIAKESNTEFLYSENNFYDNFAGHPKCCPTHMLLRFHMHLFRHGLHLIHANKGSWISDTKFSILPAPMGSKVSTPDSIASAKKTMTG